MKARVITAVVAIAFFGAVMYLLPPVCTAVLLSLLCAIGAYELLAATSSIEKNHVFVFLTMLCAFCMCYVLGLGVSESRTFLLFLILFIYTVLAFGCAVFDHMRVGYASLAKGFFASAVLPVLFSSLIRVYKLPAFGKVLVLLPFITVWFCDSFAMFGGMLLGKRKLAPYISPKKTVEGTICGLFGGMLGAFLFSAAVDRFLGVSIFVPFALAFGAVGSSLGQLGDLAFSSIKRSSGIKDYGRLFPGHGGVLDRLDSALFAFPLFELCLIVMSDSLSVVLI